MNETDQLEAELLKRIRSVRFRAMRCAIYFFGSVGFGLIFVGIKRYFERVHNPKEFLISLLGCLMFALCVLMMRREEREIMEMCAKVDEMSAARKDRR